MLSGSFMRKQIRAQTKVGKDAPKLKFCTIQVIVLFLKPVTSCDPFTSALPSLPDKPTKVVVETDSCANDSPDLT